MAPSVSPYLQWGFLQSREGKVLWWCLCFAQVYWGLTSCGAGNTYLFSIGNLGSYLDSCLKATACRKTAGMFSLSQNPWVLQANNKHADLRFYAKIQWCNAIMRELAAY